MTGAPRVVLLDSGGANLGSVRAAFARLGVDDVLTDPYRLVLQIEPRKRTHQLLLVECRPVVVAGDTNDLAVELLEPVRERAFDPVPCPDIARDKEQIAGWDSGKHPFVEV